MTATREPDPLYIDTPAEDAGTLSNAARAVMEKGARRVVACATHGVLSGPAVQRIVDWFCNGSVEEVLVGMVDTAMLDQRQLRTLADQVAKAKTKTKTETKAEIKTEAKGRRK